MREDIQEKLFSGEFNDAIKMLNYEIAENDDPDLYVAIATAYMENGQVEEGKKAIDYYLSIEDPTDEVYEILGVYYLKNNDIEKTKEYFEHGLQYNPMNANLHRNISMIYKMEGLEEEYINHLKISANIDPYSYLTMIAVAQAHIEYFELDEAEEILQSIVLSDITLPSDKIEYIESLILKINQIRGVV